MSLARSGRERQAIAIRWATLALATVTGLVFLFGHSLLALVGRGIETLSLVLMGIGLVTIYWLEQRGPSYRLSRGLVARHSGLAGRHLRRFEPPSLVLTAASEDGWAVVLRHERVPDILATGLSRTEAMSLAAFVSQQTGAHVDVPESVERELAEGAVEDFELASEAPQPRTGTRG